MGIKSGISGTSTNTFTIGDGYNTNKIIYVNNTSGLKPGIRYNTSNAYFEKSDDGYNWNKILTTNDITPTTISYTTVNPNVYENASTTVTATNNATVQYEIYTSIRRPTDGYSHFSICNFGITATSGVYRFVGYNSSTTYLTAEQTCTFYQSDDENNTLKFTLDGYTLRFGYKATVAGATCVSSVITTNFVQPTIENITKFRSADWWNGKACSEWYLTQLQLLESQAVGGGPGQVCSYAPGLTGPYPGFFGSVLGPNNNIYMIPWANNSTWYFINGTSCLLNSFTGASTTNAPYCGGILASNGRIYMAPAGQADQANWHYINTNTNVVVSFNHGLGADTPIASAYRGGALSPNGRFYMAPAAQVTQTKWHYIDTNTGAVVAYAHGVGTTAKAAYRGACLTPNNRIYFIPCEQASQSTWHYVDCNTGQIVSYPNNSGVDAVSGAYFGGVLAPNGRLYLIPAEQGNQAYWHYIDTNTGNVVAYLNNSGVSTNANAYCGGALAPNGRIYLAPNVNATQSQWHYIDTNTGNVVAYTHGVTVISAAYLGCTLLPNGRIYMVPNGQANQASWHYIDTQSEQPLNKNICLNPMYNKI